MSVSSVKPLAIYMYKSRSHFVPAIKYGFLCGLQTGRIGIARFQCHKAVEKNLPFTSLLGSLYKKIFEKTDDDYG